MVEGLPGPDFAGVAIFAEHQSMGEAPVPCGAGASLRVFRGVLLSGAYCLWRIGRGVLSRVYFLCSENVLRRYCRYFSRE